MVRVRSTLPSPPWSLDFDDYIPATVRWSTPGRSTPYYFRLRGDAEALVEVGVDPETYGVCKLNIVSIGRLGSRRFPDAPEAVGSPVFQPSPEWTEPPARTDVRGAVEFSYSAPNLSVLLAGAETATLVYDAGGAKFAVGPQGELLAMQVALPDGPHDARLRRIAGES